MSSRPVFLPYPVITNGDMSGNLLSKITIVKMLSLVSYSVSWSGASPIGVMSVEVSNDYAQNTDGSVLNAGTWNTLPLDVPAAVANNTDNGFIDIDLNGGYAMRLRYTRTSGTGTMQAIISCKVA